jgi:hypothetical protein
MPKNISSPKVFSFSKIGLEMNVFDAFKLAKIKHPDQVDN